MDVKVGGKEITFDLEKVTITEYRKFASGGMLNSEDDGILAKASGEEVTFFQGLSQPDYRRALRAFFEKASAPLSDPN